jgi:hypothetical protein
MRLFVAPIAVSAVVLLAMFVWGGTDALLLTAALVALEVSLSFDNAIINARVLARMSPHWQRRFITWGMPVAVFGVRFVLPVLIVATAALASPWAIALLAFNDPAEYARLLTQADPIIHAFGGAFLLMVSLTYFFDEEKEVHWFAPLERRFARWGQLKAIESLAVLCAVVAVAITSAAPAAVLGAGSAGIVLYLVIDKLTTLLAHSMTRGMAAGLSLFIYLNVLDAAFSLDGVVGAFALTTQILVILAGLGIGAYFVRSFTVYLTRRGILRQFIYLEHGAHWAIFFLALCLFAALFTHVPEVIPGTIGLVFAVLSYFSSRRIRASTLGQKIV